MMLSRNALNQIKNKNVSIPESHIFSLPEKVLQFGTGILLRGLPDYYIDKANRLNKFNGRVVVVKSTNLGNTSVFDDQNGLYTHCIRGVKNGLPVEENIINASISRVLSASFQWNEILSCAHSADMQIIISNTTEVGIQYVEELLIENVCPHSYPAKLLAFLYERYIFFNGAESSGMIIIPTELLPDNASKLRSIINKLATHNNMDAAFINWIDQSNHFCNSLVDRIVPGGPDETLKTELENSFGYEDNLMIISEPYGLWAIEGNDYVKEKLSFSLVDNSVIIIPDIQAYRELKLRLLNGTHSLSCGLAFTAGFKTVLSAMNDPLFSSYIKQLMLSELVPSLPSYIEHNAAVDFASNVLERFYNPFIRHAWLNISLQYSSKIRLRCIPLLKNYIKKTGKIPQLFTLGFAAYIYFTHPVVKREDQYMGLNNQHEYLIQDEQALVYFNRWSEMSIKDLVQSTLSDNSFWSEDLSQIPQFPEAVEYLLNLLLSVGPSISLERTMQTYESINVY